MLHAGDLLTDVRVRLGLSGGVGGGGAVAVLGPAFQHGGGAVGSVYADADGEDMHGESPRAKRGPERRVGHAPRAQLAIGGLPGIDVRERRRLVVDGDRQFEGKVSRDLRLPLRTVHPVREVFPVDAERLEPPYFVGLGGEPSEGRPLDDVIEREQAPYEDVRRRILAPAVANVRDSESPIDGLTGQDDGARAAGEDGPLVLGGELLLDEGADFATLVSVDWFNMRRLLGPIEDIPPAEFEAQYYQQAKVAYFNEFGLRDSRYDSVQHIVGLNEAADFISQFAHAGEDPPPEGAPLQLAEPGLDGIEP